MRPEADVDLLSARQFGHDVRRPAQQRPELGGLAVFELSHVEDVSARLDDEGADAERANAVLDEPAPGVVQDATRQRPPSLREVAGEAAGLAHQNASRVRAASTTRATDGMYASSIAQYG